MAVEVDLSSYGKPDPEPSPAVKSKAAKILAEHGVVCIDSGQFEVSSPSSNSVYSVLVTESDEGPIVTCTCMSGQNKGPRVRCSHSLAVKMWIAVFDASKDEKVEDY